MQSSPRLHALDASYREFVDVNYTLPNHSSARTRIEYDTCAMALNRTHVSKELMRDVVFRRMDDDEREACRIACAKETPVVNPPQSCVPTHVRIQQRRRFVDRREGCVVWSYELSRTWSGPSHSAAEYMQSTVEPNYEVECELVDENGSYLSARSDEQVVDSLLLKSLLLLGSEWQETLQTISVTAGKRPVSKQTQKNARRVRPRNVG